MFFKNCELRQTEKYGCGVFAIRDIEPNEILFSDVPLILGPTGKSTDPIVCIMCYRKIKTEQNSKKFMCKNGCGLAICESIECAQKHKDECTLLKHWQPKNSSEISFKRTRALINIRSLFLNESQTKFLSLMQRNFTINKFEMYFVREFENFPSDIELATQLRSTSAAVNTNAIQILYRPSNSDDVHMRALYPIISLLNHHCVPNTRRNVDSEFKSNVSATRKIFKNEEIFTSYSQLLWGTNSRRMQLMVSKQFLCVCDRCVDQTEYGTNISAIKCKNKQCTGFVLPIMPIDFQSNAKCSECEQICDNKRYLQVQDIASAMVKNFLNTPEINLTKAIEFLETKLNLIVPDCNQFVIELKLEILWKCNSTEPKGKKFNFYFLHYYPKVFNLQIYQ